ncbi:MAG: hypothetical protein HQL76_16415 [Magnetococcales bacterium]|nr:hypothetical protein [Magnetococcales bacterium]
MNRSILKIALFLVLLPAWSSALAEENKGTVVNFCGGPKGLSYERLPKTLQPIMDGFGLGFSVAAVETKGGDENVEKVARGECDFGLAPNKLVHKYTLPIDGVVFHSYAHLVCNQERTKGAKEIADLLKQGRKIQVAVGDVGSASKIVWDSLAGLDNDFGPEHFATMPLSFTKAIPLVMKGQYDCAWTVSGIGSPALKVADYPGAAKVLRLIEVNDGDFNDDDYDFFVIPKSTYPNLQEGWFKDVKTIDVPVVLFHRPGLQADNPVAHGAISGEALRVGPELFKD